MIWCYCFSPSETEITTLKSYYNPIKKEKNLHVQYLIDIAVLTIVKTTYLIVKFDSRVSFNMVPQLENFSAYVSS